MNFLYHVLIINFLRRRNSLQTNCVGRYLSYGLEFYVTAAMVCKKNLKILLARKNGVFQKKKINNNIYGVCITCHVFPPLTKSNVCSMTLGIVKNRIYWRFACYPNVFATTWLLSYYDLCVNTCLMYFERIFRSSWIRQVILEKIHLDDYLRLQISDVITGELSIKYYCYF